MSVEVAAKNTCSTITEGPHWEEKSQTLIYVDIDAGDVHRYNPETGVDTKAHLDGPVGFIVPRQSGGYVVGLGRKLVHFNWDKNETQILHEVDQGTQNRWNDGKCDHSGRIWAGTMGHETSPAVVELEKGSLFSLNNGQLKTHKTKISISNGLAWTADEKTMYYIDSIPRKVYGFDYDAKSGEISNQRVAVDFGSNETVPTLGYPDGMCIDQEGMIWVACYSVGKVVRFDPNTGKELRTVSIPAKRTTSCCFGGKNLDELYVTAARKGASAEELEAQPLSGSVFRVRGLGVKGYAGCEYAG